MKIGFIGAGNMGEAYISALNEENQIFFYEQSAERRSYIEQNYKAESCNNYEDLIKKSDYVVIAVKPQVVVKLLISLSKINISDKIFISIVAGLKIAKMEDILGENRKVVRVMPNTPALIGKGISGVTYGSMITEEDTDNILNIISSTGKYVVVEENQQDIVTAISGSGPAYVFMLINSLAEGGVKLGMTKKTALELAVETFIGSAELIKSTGKHPEELKDMVTSPGGTTAAGLFKMEENGIRKSMIETVEAAFHRARDLGKDGDKK